MKAILITGSAGFIGFHTAKRLLEDGNFVIGIDNMNDYYNPLLKEKRNEELSKYRNYKFYRLDFSDWDELNKKLRDEEFDIIIHLGAQAGVRYSLKNPWAYERSNVLGTLNIFELARKRDINKVIYASSSSVYGGNTKVPFSEDDRVDTPISLYATTKRCNELMAYTYHHLYGIQMIGLRFFTVYGEYGRPDMAFWKFTKNILLGKPIEVYNYGNMERDFTYISDIVNGIYASVEYKKSGYEIFNLGNDRPVNLEYAISLIEKYTGKKAIKKYLPMQPGDVPKTWADLTKSRKELGYEPKVPIEEGLKRFVEWFMNNWEWAKNI
ncbi:MAG TPA: NAD-dependent epimerase/dehydratase family protein [Thermococcus litoralis]|uniref:NAD-dependent epimerase/dehydratase family protein n=1 Tax=Thermococcus litoralis TaxID=2265 RepID=A0A7C5P2P5_THELI|nr:NAD-dependent epimerase/dehydratase family protein [Thermococcus litoralis]